MDSPISSIKVIVKEELKHPFADWQAKFNRYIAAFKGFVSLEIISPKDPDPLLWVIIERFNNREAASSWKRSNEYQELMEDLKALLGEGEKDTIKEESVNVNNLQGGVTEVFVTQVNPKQDQAFREWIAKIHQVEANFQGFRGVYVQSPSGEGKDWITLLQFDTPENLDRWLLSKERQEVLKDSKALIANIESHRVISSYGGWFASIAKQGSLPPLWKQTMVILLVLFPIVMLELKYLTPQLNGLNSAVKTFIGNALSVVLISWPMMPVAIMFLGWWLSPENVSLSKTVLGTCLVFGLYALEIALFWHLLS